MKLFKRAPAALLVLAFESAVAIQIDLNDPGKPYPAKPLSCAICEVVDLANYLFVFDSFNQNGCFDHSIRFDDLLYW